jgi:hypothetical protein
MNKPKGVIDPLVIGCMGIGISAFFLTLLGIATIKMISDACRFL